ncbi:DNA repair protein RadA/Sms [Ruminococcaceae bacterium KH2T8]|nr:DNA repair protein RadA/Sms [Ruminococcaceae bacterium KH2T8]
MAKSKITFFCKECGFETSGWMGKCPGCGQWNTLVESTTVTGSGKSSSSSSAAAKSDAPAYRAAGYNWTKSNATVRLKDAGKEVYTRFSTGIPALDDLFGGGITNGSVTLVGGEPGIGKSTLLLQMADSLKAEGDVLYVSGEESPAQIGMRAERLGIDNDRIIICAQTSFELIAEEMQNTKPVLCIIDSIQTLFSENITGTPGSVSQAREVTAGLIRIAKSNNMPIILVGHVTKEGSIAGPKTLEHMVDTVLYFEGDNTGSYRMLRSVKNRFGKSNELSFFEMQQTGLKSVDSSSALLVMGRPLNAPGSALTSTLEGGRALTVEIQALASDSCYGTPQRMTSGPDRNRTTMLLAVAEQTFKLALNTKDCFINVIGGLRITDPACDLALIAAVVSSVRGIPIRENTLILGEVGLSGELRPVSAIAQRVADAVRIGITNVVLPSSCRNAAEQSKKESSEAEFIFVDNISEAADVLFSGGK